MKKPMARTIAKAPPQTLTRALRRTDKSLLSFVPQEHDPLDGVEPGPTHDVTAKREIDAVGKAFRDAAKRSIEDMLHERSGYGADYCVLVFQDVFQVNTFLRDCKYPAPFDMFIDGTVLAQLLGIEIPESTVAPKQLKAEHNQKLTRLARPMKTKGA